MRNPFKKRLCLLLCAVLLLMCSGCEQPRDSIDPDATYAPIGREDYIDEQGAYTGEKRSYMVYYGVLNEDIINTMKEYEVVIIHPKQGNVTREQVQEIRRSGTIVLGYISIGEDLRTNGLTPEEMLEDSRFTGDGTGPRVDARDPGETRFNTEDSMGKPSPAGTGYASYYLDDNDYDGKPDINVNFKCAFTNIGNAEWFEVLDSMRMDGIDQTPGIREILSDNYGRALGCDGLFLDTIDTCAPNAFTADTDSFRTRYEWTAPGLLEFCKRLKDKYPDKYVLQNRGLFFFNPTLPAFEFNPRHYIDFLLFESYMLDSNTYTTYTESYHLDNRYNYVPKIMAEANRTDGFRVLSLGYAEGPPEYELLGTLMGYSTVGADILMEDIYQAEDKAGFTHYITDGAVVVVNDYVITHQNYDDTEPPEWTSVYNSSTAWPPEAPQARVGIQKATAIDGGVKVSWDVALDKNHVDYTLYYQTTPFDFKNDPDLTSAEKYELTAEVGDGYLDNFGPDVLPNQCEVTGLIPGKTYYLVIRACDTFGNEEKNEVYLKVKVTK